VVKDSFSPLQLIALVHIHRLQFRNALS